MIKKFGAVVGWLVIISSLSLAWAGGGGALTPDTPISGEIAERGEQDVYTYAGQANEVITVTITAEAGSSLDTALELYDPEGNFLISNDDADATTTNSALEYTLPVEGEYRIVAMAFAGASQGAYEIVLGSSGVSAEIAGGALEYGEPATGSLVAGGSATYTLSGAEGDLINVAVDAIFDSFLDVYLPDGALLLSDDDAGPGLNPFVRSLTLPATGDYQLKLSSLPNELEGDYSLVVNQLTALENTLAYEETLEAEIGLNEIARITFEGSAGDIIEAKVTGEFDNFLQLFAPDGSFLLEDDDSGGSVQAAILEYTLPQTGTFTLEVTGFSPADVGSFTLDLALVGQGEPPVVEETITYGEVVEAITTGTASFIFTGAANDVVTISVDAVFDAKLSLYDPAGTLLAEDDDSGVGLNPLLENIGLPTDGDYRIEITAFGDLGTGEFSLTLENNPEAVATTPVPVAEGDRLEYGSSIEGELALGETAEYVFAGTAGDVVSISATAAFDGFLELRDSASNVVTSDDDSGGDLNPLIENATLPTTGDYTILYSSFGGQGSGAFTLTLTGESGGAVATTSDTPTVMNFEESQRGSLSVGATREYLFNAEPGDRASISVASTEWFGEFDPYIELYAPSGELLATDDDGGWMFNSALVNVELPESGTYRVAISSFAGVSQGDFVISLGRGEAYFAPDGQPAQNLPLNGGSAALSVDLGANQVALYRLNASQGQTITATNSNEGAISLSLYSLTQETILTTDVPYEVPENGTYLLLVFSQQGGTADISVTLAGQGAAITSTSGVETSAVPVPEGATLVEGGELQADVPLRGFIEAAEIQTWTFTPQLEGVYSVVLNSDDRNGYYDPYLRVLDVEGNILGEDDDSGGNFNALVANLALAAGQTIIIEVRGFAEQVGGTFLLVVVTETTEEPVVIMGGNLVAGSAVDNALLLRGQEAQFSLTIADAGIYTLSISGLKLPYIDIYDAEGNLVARGAGVIEKLMLEPGTYTLVVFDRLNRTGGFRISVEAIVE